MVSNPNRHVPDMMHDIDEMVSAINSGGYPDGLHFGILLRKMLMQYRVSPHQVQKIIEDCYIKPKLLREHSGKLYQGEIYVQH